MSNQSPDAHELLDQREKFESFSSKALKEKALDRKTKMLIAAATASAGGSPGSSAHYVQEAREAGASNREVAEALSVTWTQGGGTQVFWMKEDFDDLLGKSWRSEFIPETDRAFWDFKREVFSEGALDRKTKELIAVAVSSILRCRHCTRGHVQAALNKGATRQEVAEALAVLWAVGGEVQVACIEHEHTSSS